MQDKNSVEMQELVVYFQALSRRGATQSKALFLLGKCLPHALQAGLAFSEGSQAPEGLFSSLSSSYFLVGTVGLEPPTVILEFPSMQQDHKQFVRYLFREGLR